MLRDAATETALPLIGIYEISKVLGSTLDMDKALHDVLNILSSYLHMRHGAIVLRDPEGEALEISAVAGMSLKLARSGELRYPMAAVAKVVQTGIPMVVPDAADEPLLAEYIAHGQGEDDEPVSFFCVPIKTTGKPLGALSVERSWEGGVRHVFEHDLRFLTMVATLVGQTVGLHHKVAADRGRLLEQNARLAKQMEEVKPAVPVQGLEDIVGNSEAMGRVFAQVQQAAPTKATILLRGESGTGKEMIARAIHILSPRSAKAFIKVNCAALAESVLESELFGHEKGSFTGASAERKGRFELANGGTLFLDEIGEISAPFQAKLLRVLQEGEFERVGGSKTIKVDIRLVAATNRNLEEAVAKNEFRADLYYRLNVVPIFLPPLRERQGDIPLLAMYFLKRFNEENGRQLTFSAEALANLQGCFFPGNVRELENCVTRSATMCRGAVVTEMDLSCRRDTCLSSVLWNIQRPANPPVAPIMPSAPPPQPAPQPAPPMVAAAPPPPPPSAAAIVPPPAPDLTEADLSERERLVQAMEKCGWVQAKAARLLGLTPRQIGYALKKHGIEIRQL
ncbi:nif-specific transcriptional activator NifA [Magnetospirillum sp. UT-4]|uniref:nif-specific transcriptional activator NifA n=1 Tax=Magnetospirillum sp. UT-4 TaxID=2681467 RepID=UPI00137F616D|nr:nif-specific transcriptional activator NifA [Magnetospirillum sp. UT-4]CAA7625398.1 Nif-specific regulatory protein [Magnetospirillum sp. UT-4]